MSIPAIVKYTKKSRSFVVQWIEHYKQHKNVNDQPNVKPNRASTSREAGFGKLTVFTGILNAERMNQLYKSTLLPTARKFFGTDNSEWLLLEDNDPKHKSRLCNAWKEENGIEQMVWPPQSPDCNPIENVWSIIKARLKGKHFRNIQQLSSFITRQWNSFSANYARNLSQSMPSRCARVIEKQGEWIKY